MLTVLVEEVAHREVVQLQTDAADDASLSPTQRELYLVIALLLQIPVDVHGSVLHIGLHVGQHLLGLEVTHGCQLTLRALQGVLGEEVAGLGAQLATYHVFIQTVVTVDAHVVDVGLRTLLDTHFEVDAVAYHVDFGRHQVVEQVTRVPVVVTHGVLVFGESLVQQLLVVHVALVHAQHAAQIVGGIDGVAHPRDVAQIVLLAFIHLDAYAHVLVVMVPHAVRDNLGVAETVLVVFLNQTLLVGLPALGGKLLGFEEAAQRTRLMGLGKGALLEEAALDDLGLQLVVALDVYLAYLQFLFLVDHHVEDYLVLASHVLALVYVYLGVLVAFLVKILLGQNLGTVYRVGRHLHTFEQTQLGLHILTLRLLQTDVVDGRHARTHLQIDVQIDFVSYQRVGIDFHLREEAVLPVALHGVGNL